MTIDEQVAALSTGRAFCELRGWWTTVVTGADARSWLGDLVTAAVETLAHGDAVRSLLLSPTGRMRADFTIAAVAGGFLLVQDPIQPARLEALLAPYVLSSDVSLEDRSEELAVFAFPGHAPRSDKGERYTPSALGAGTDVVVNGSEAHHLRDAVANLLEVDLDGVETWRIVRGAARFAVDLSEDSLPHEAALDDAIAYAKGCFLGQEAVAKVRNLGRPPFVVVALRSDVEVRRGDRIVARGEEVGAVTSAASVSGAWSAIGRVRWAARDAELRTRSGAALRSLGPASGADPKQGARR
ncbi:MAG TPA: hypothetical protein VG709_05290 [Actinomycetota bacterium]|nr:hypothetical protein [Actinomycetota bacterium]